MRTLCVVKPRLIVSRVIIEQEKWRVIEFEVKHYQNTYLKSCCDFIYLKVLLVLFSYEVFLYMTPCCQYCECSGCFFYNELGTKHREPWTSYTVTINISIILFFTVSAIVCDNKNYHHYNFNVRKSVIRISRRLWWKNGWKRRELGRVTWTILQVTWRAW